MSKKSLTELVDALQGQSVTHGWDAITLYDQRKANALLAQLHIERFTTRDGYFKPASFSASWGDGSYKEHLYDLTFGAPRLSFESADPARDACARLTMDMVGGMIVSTRKDSGRPGFVSRVLRILPVGGPQLWMSQPISKAQVVGTGDVLLDLRNADTFMANFVLGSLAQEQIGKRFKQYFDSLAPALKVYSLGSLTGELNGPLTPTHFEIRTMKADPLARPGDRHYGEGAVMLFITLKGGVDGGSYPSNHSLYLLPADGPSANYSGALYLSSRVLFENILREQALADIGHGIEFRRYSGGQDLAWQLEGVAGGLEHPFTYDYKTRSEDFDCQFQTTLGSAFKADHGGPALTLKGLGRQLGCSWRKTYKSPFSRAIHWGWPSHRQWNHGEINFTCDYQVRFDVQLEPGSGLVSFKRNEQASRFATDMTSDAGWLPDLGDVQRAMRQRLQAFYGPKLRAILRDLSAPSLDTFLLRNLLFPGHNALHLSDAFVPGDLAVFGEIDPLRSRCVLAPANQVLEAGRQLQFSLTPLPQDICWSVRNIDEGASVQGSINSQGLLTAPAAETLVDGSAILLVTARGLLDGHPVQSSALVSVMENLIVTNPLFDSCAPGEARELTAQALDGGVLEWEILTREWGSQLEEVPGEPHKRRYIAGGSSDRNVPFSLERIEVRQTRNGVVTRAGFHVLIFNQPITTALYLSEASDPQTGRVQFELRGRNGPVQAQQVTWKLLGGAGSLDCRTGTYTEPAWVVPGSLAVVAATLPGDFMDIHAVAVVPLPLCRYAQLLKDVDVAHQQPCEALAQDGC